MEMKVQGRTKCIKKLSLISYVAFLACTDSLEEICQLRDFIPSDEVISFAGFFNPDIELSNDWDHLMDQFIPNLRDETVQTAVKNLLTYSLTIIVIPLGSMFFLKKFFFEEELEIVKLQEKIFLVKDEANDLCFIIIRLLNTNSVNFEYPLFFINRSIAWLRQSKINSIFCNSRGCACSRFAFFICIHSVPVRRKAAEGRIVAVMLTEMTFSKYPVYLGFGNVLEPQLSYRLLSHYMPLGKIGGKPAWLNPVSLPANNFLLCRVCEKPMVFLIQVYATSPNDQDYSFHRTLFFFICRNSQCSRSNDASNVRAFRCTLSRFNDFYASEQPIDPDLEGDVPDPFWKQTYPHLCQICGCSATKKCARCESIWYCSREHQTIDWSASHKRECCKQSSANDSAITDNGEKNDENSWVKRKRSIPINAFVFPEYAIEMGMEHLPRSSHIDSDDDDDDNSDSDDGNAEKRMEEYRQYIKKHKSPCDSSNGDLEDLEDFSDKDTAFKYFNKVVALNPEQVLRYSRGGEPLLATDHAPPPEAIPPCSLCGSERQFELQLMPHLLALIGVDDLGKSIDWATLMLYTCAQNCHVPNDGYAEEYVHKQDFH